jgi:methylated-DNA-[protein]-cysteine S-methyltransferase
MAGELKQFNLPLAPEGTAFRKQVWTALCDVPWGETVSYGDIAKSIGRPSASRAVGAANGANPLPIIVPCHRIIGSSGKLTGYAGGLHIKQFLLQLEGVMPQQNLSL